MTDALWDLVRERNPRHRAVLDEGLAQLLDPERADLGRYVAHLAQQGLSLSRMADCYLTLVDDILREQIHFRRHRAYRHSTYAEVAASVYDDPDYMTRYMVGLGLSTYVWPNHVAMRRFAERTMPPGRGGGYLEVGPGHGLAFLHAMTLGGYGAYVGVDVSATSLELTRSLLVSRRGPLPPTVTLHHGDFLEQDVPGAPFDAIVLGEVIEHVEQPLAFLRRAVALAGPDTWLHVTTCVNSPAIDHIYLFGTDAEVEAMLAEAGLDVQDRLLLGHATRTLEQSRADKLPINVAYVCQVAR